MQPGVVASAVIFVAASAIPATAAQVILTTPQTDYVITDPAGIDVRADITAQAASAIFAADDFDVLLNSALISGSAGPAINLMGGVNAFTNTGRIEATDAPAIHLEGMDAVRGTFENAANGEIVSGLVGLMVRGGTLSRFVNHGTISGAAWAGVYFDSAVPAAFVNTGTIEGEVALRFGVNDRSDGITLSNAGLLHGTSGTAIEFEHGATDPETGFDDLLILLPGSRIEGVVDFGGGTDTLDFSRFTGDAIVAVAGLETVAAGDRLYVWDKDAATIAITSPTLISGAPVGDGQVAIVHGLNAFLDSRSWSAPRVSGFTLTYAPVPPIGAETAVLSALDVSPGTTRLWGDVFGAAGTGAAKTSVGGVAIGLDTTLDSRLMLGAVASYAAGGARLAGGQTIASQTGAFGLYGEYDAGALDIGFSLLAGVQNHDSARLIATGGGSETARGRFTGLFVAPGADVTVPLHEAGDTRLSARAAATYVAGATTPYTETGSSMNLSVGSRTISRLDTRLGLEARRSGTLGGLSGTARLRAGLLAQFDGGSAAVPVTLLGQTSRVPAPGGTSTGLYAGAGAEAALGPASLTLDLDATARSDGSANLALRAGLRGDM